LHDPKGDGSNRVFIESDVINEAAVDAEVHPTYGIPRFRSFALTASGSAHLDLIRAAAAWAVMWGHLRGLFFVDYPQVVGRSGWLGAIYFLTGFGHQAVMVFFVLSGFFISSAIFKRHDTRTWSWRDYAVDRTSRLYVVLIPGLLFGALWDTIGSHRLAETGLYTRPLLNLGYAVARDGLNVRDFFGNLFFLQTIVCRTFGSNAPLWSLANEFWYYVLFPLGLAAGLAWAGRFWRRGIVLTMLTLGVAIFVGPGMLVEFLIWLAGCVLAVAYLRLKVSSKAWLIGYLVVSLTVLGVSLTAVRTGIPDRRFGSDLIVGSAFALLLFGVLQIGLRTAHLGYARFTHWCAGFSYSLYVLHFPLLLLLRARLAPRQRWQPDGAHLLLGVLLGAVVLAFAWLVSLVTESNTHVVRNWMKKTILRENGDTAR
jgi:peptidoglycan/LPS O-acetylase OafA/YrhL